MVRIAFLGDIAFLGQFDKSKSRDVEERVEFLKKELKGYDFVIANLESPLTNKNSTLVCKSMHLKAHPCNAELLKYLNVSAVSLANNHIADYGMQGVQDTIQALEEAGIQWFGVGGKSLDLSIREEKISVSGFCCYSTNGTHYGEGDGINLLTRDALKKQLEQDKENGAFSIAALHWGMEHTNYPAYEHIMLAHNLLQKYNAVLCGHHPHIVQGIEKIENSLVAYSLGNCIFDTCVSRNGRLNVELNEENRKSFILGINVEGQKLIQYKTTGFYIGASGIRNFEIQEHLGKISERLKEIGDVEQYENMRKQEFQKVIQSKFGRHDLRWLMSRMNYYAIGARIQGMMRAKKYQKEAERFING